MGGAPGADPPPEGPAAAAIGCGERRGRSLRAGEGGATAGAKRGGGAGENRGAGLEGHSWIQTGGLGRAQLDPNQGAGPQLDPNYDGETAGSKPGAIVLGHSWNGAQLDPNQGVLLDWGTAQQGENSWIGAQLYPNGGTAG